MRERVAKTPWLALAAIVAVALALRVVQLGTKSFWLDEADSLLYATASWRQFSQVIAYRELNQLPYYLLLREWIHLGTGEAVVRTLSVLPAVATVPALYALGAALFDRSTGLAAGALLAVNAYHIEFSQEARAYTLLVLLVTLSLVLLVYAVRGRSVALWGAWAVASALAVYTHFYGALTVGAECVALLAVPRRVLSWRRLAGVYLGISALLLPLALYLAQGRVDDGYWIPATRAATVGYLFKALLGIETVRWTDPIVIALAVAVLAGVAIEVRRRRTAEDRWPVILLAASALLPLAAVLAASLVKPFFVPKYLIEMLPPLVLLVAAGILALRPRALGAAVLAVLLAACLVSDVGYYRRAPREDWRAATRYILSERAPSDATLFYPTYVRAGFEVYRRAVADSAAEARTVNGDVIAQLASGPAQRALTYPRMWLVLSHGDGLERVRRDTLLARLSHRYAKVSERRFTGIRVLLFEAPRDSIVNTTG